MEIDEKYQIEIVDYDDVDSDEHIIGFSSPLIYRGGQFMAIFSSGEEPASSAKVGVNPEALAIPVDLMRWALDIADVRLAT